jgi:tRNA uridine 5-carboxymethylaminomethyl modification enzyme
MDVGLVHEARKTIFLEKSEALERGKSILTAKSFTPSEINAAGIKVNQDGDRRTAFQVLSFPNITLAEIERLEPESGVILPEIKVQLSNDALYATYIERQRRDVEAMKRDERHTISTDFSYTEIEGLSNELKDKLEKARPSNLAQASKIDGMTPAGLTLILAKLRQAERSKSA